MQKYIDRLPIEWIEKKIGKKLPITGGSGLSESDPLVLSGVHRSEVPSVERLIVELTLQKYNLMIWSFNQTYTEEADRNIDKIKVRTLFLPSEHKDAPRELNFYFEIT